MQAGDMQIRTRILKHVIALTAGVAACAPFAAAQTAPAPAPMSGEPCSVPTVTIYYDDEASALSPETQALIGKVGSAAAECASEHLTLVARVRPGASAEELEATLQWMKRVSRELQAAGLSSARIRMSAEQASPGVAARYIDIVTDEAARRMPPAAGDPPPYSVISYRPH
ncbi:MAG: hypothetical protein R3C52_11475 [Hyphomonadaceae bacterium]